MAKSKANARKPKQKKNSAEHENKDEHVEETVEGKEDVAAHEQEEGVKATNEEAVAAEVIDDRTSESEKQEPKNAKEEEQVVGRSTRPKRGQKTASKAEEEVLTQQYEELRKAEAVKGKKKGSARTRTGKEHVDFVNEADKETAAEEAALEKIQEFPGREEEAKGTEDAEAGPKTKRGKGRKGDGMKVSEDVTDQKLDEKPKGGKRGARGMKRVAEEHDAMEVCEDGNHENAEDYAEYRCTDHQIDPDTKVLQFKLLSQKNKVKVISPEAAKQFANSTCFDYMVQKISSL